MILLKIPDYYKRKLNTEDNYIHKGQILLINLVLTTNLRKNM